MPSVQTYVREEDYLAYLSIKTSPEGWAEFVHNALQLAEDYTALSPKEKTHVKQVIKQTAYPPVNIPGVVRGADFVPKPPDPETGYPCCVKRSPCKHWVWDDMDTVWRNTLTNKTREE